MASAQEAQRPWWGEFVCAGSAAVLAICFTNPVDVVKTRLVLQGQLGQGATPYRGVIPSLFQIGRAEGWRGLQLGLPPACLWQFSNVSVRFGVYSIAKQRLGAGQEVSPVLRWLQSMGIAAVSGGLGAIVSCPFFIIKTRLQATSKDASLAVGHQHGDVGRGLLSALRGLCSTDGPLGLFRGLSAFAPRVMVASAVQLSTYDSVKMELVRRWALPPKATSTHVAASLITGVAVVACMQPFDFAATRLMNSLTPAEVRQQAAGTRSEVVFSGPMDVIRKTVAAEGVLGVYKGAAANYLRFGPYCVLVFVFVEKLRLLEAAMVPPSRS